MIFFKKYKLDYFWILLFGIIFLSAFIFKDGFQNYFFQDDFFLLKISQAKNLTEFLNFFSPNRPYTFYRPLSTEVYFFVNQTFFGFNPLMFRVVSFIFFAGSTILVALIVKHLTRSKFASILTAFFYGVSAIHFGEFFWSSVHQMISVAFFYLFSFYCYLLFRQGKKLVFFLLSLFSFCLALLSMELAITFPLILIAYEFLFLKKLSKGKIFSVVLKSSPFLIVLLAYVIFRLSVHKLPLAETYQVDFSLKPVLGNLRWYILWSFGLPVILIDYIGPGLKINPNLIKFFLLPILITLIWVIIFLSLVFISLILVLRNKKSQFLKKKIFWFSILWFMISILPVVYFQWHKFSYYLTVAHFGFSLFLALLLGQVRNLSTKLSNLLIVLVVAIFLIGNINTIKLTYRTSWLVTRAKLAKTILENFKKDYPSLPKNSKIYFINDPSSPKINNQWGFSSNQAYVALSGSNAIQVLYNDPTINVYYEDVNTPPDNIKGEDLIKIIAPAEVK